MPKLQTQKSLKMRRNIYIAASLFLFAMFGVSCFAVFKVFDNFYTQRLTLVWTFLVLLLIHDAYFYWVHRLLHNRFMFRFHRIHHIERDTVMSSAWVMHPVESLLEAAFFPLAACLPIEPLGLVTFGGVVFLINTLGHRGRENYPKWFLRFFPGRVLTTATHHSQHHIEFRVNYGAYFRFWDVICKTESENYLNNLRR